MFQFGISLAELLRRSLRSILPMKKTQPWMRYAGMIASGDHVRLMTSCMARKTEAYVDTSAFIALTGVPLVIHTR